MYKIAIPSYKREATCRDKTLAYLKECGIDPKLITIFVSDDSQRKVYEETIDKQLYGNIVVGVVGMKEARNFIFNYYDIGTNVVNIDDDISEIHMRDNDKKSHKFLDLHNLFIDAFKKCAEYNARLWGIYPVLNPMFMNDRVTFDLKFVTGCFFGAVIKDRNTIVATTGEKEDLERSMRCYLADGRVIRYEYLAPKTNYYTEPGGMQLARTKDSIDRGARYLAAKYAELCTLNLTRKSGLTELRLRDTRKIKSLVVW